MGAYVFNNQIFDNWLTRMSDEILSKVNREAIKTEEMIILILKAQTNHFHHMDVEMDQSITELKEDMQGLRAEIKGDMQSLRNEMKEDMQSLRTEMKDDMQSLRNELKGDIQDLRNEMKEDTNNLRNELKSDIQDLRNELKEDFHKIDAKMDSRFMWSIGVTITMSLGLYIKLFLG